MVVDIFADGRCGPGKNQHPAFAVIRLPGVRESELAYLLEGPLGPEKVDELGNTVKDTVGRRRDIIDRAKFALGDAAAWVVNKDATVQTTLTGVENLTTRVYDDAKTPAVISLAVNPMLATYRKTNNRVVAIQGRANAWLWRWIRKLLDWILFWRR